MPGANCSIYGCSTSRRNKDISIFRLPTANSEENKKWRSALISVITRDREIDDSLKKRIQCGHLFICERHYKAEQMWIYPTRKSLKDGAIPSENLPPKSHASSTQTSRSTSAIEKREESMLFQLSPPTSPKPTCYKDLFDFKYKIKQLKLNEWSINMDEDSVVCISKIDVNYLVPKFEIYVDASLKFTVRIFGWILPSDHELCSKYDSSFIHITLSSFLYELYQHEICIGITKIDMHPNLDFEKHIVPRKFILSNYKLTPRRNNQDVYYRSPACKILTISPNPCLSCDKKKVTHQYELNRKKITINKPAKLNAPIKFTSPDRIKLTLQQERLKCKQLEENIKKMKLALATQSHDVSNDLNKDFVSIFTGANKKEMPPFMKLFWEEQQKYIKASSSSSVRYHPMIIKYCLAIASKSSSAYSELRHDSKTGSGVLVLPSLRTLRDYKNYIRPTIGFNHKVVEELTKKTADFSYIERFVTLIFDEMKIQEDLVWDKYSGELVGYVDLGDIYTNYATLKDTETLATHVLVFLVKSIVNPLSYSFATFATTGVRSSELMNIFWKAVALLEKYPKLKVIATTADGASPNRRLFRIHKQLDGNAGKDVVYRTKNIFAKDNRFIYFFADVPHLIKTARNCLASSGAGRATRYMWNDGFYILWNHIAKFYYDELDSGLKTLTKLTTDHINLTSYSVMRVNLAAQVLSETVGKVLNEFGPPDAAGTAKFCLNFDKFFDCLNVRNTKENKTKQKPFLKPYDSINDERFEWLMQFLEYFKQWKESIDARPGNFTANAKANMFISWQTYEGIQITVHSFIEIVKFLLQEGVPYVLSERFCQDDLENYFGKQRAIGRRKDNPSVRDVGYNDNTIKTQFSVRPIAGNVQKQVGKYNVIDTTPLPKRKKTLP